MVARRAHNPEVEGSIPSPDTCGIAQNGAVNRAQRVVTRPTTIGLAKGLVWTPAKSGIPFDSGQVHLNAKVPLGPGYAAAQYDKFGWRGHPVP